MLTLAGGGCCCCCGGCRCCGGCENGDAERGAWEAAGRDGVWDTLGRGGGESDAADPEVETGCRLAEVEEENPGDDEDTAEADSPRGSNLTTEAAFEAPNMDPPPGLIRRRLGAEGAAAAGGCCWASSSKCWLMWASAVALGTLRPQTGQSTNRLAWSGVEACEPGPEPLRLPNIWGCDERHCKSGGLGFLCWRRYNGRNTQSIPCKHTPSS